tara:strand:- start:182 stop:943 length:762 start_codon:yes stop_codon:yes gene_type:complete
MLLVNFYHFNLSLLKRKAKQLNIKNYHSLNKKNLLTLVQNSVAALIIQYGFRRSHSSNGNVCPLTLETLQYPLCPIKLEKGSKFVYYNLQSLVSYFLYTGDFRDPFTRRVIKKEELKAMDDLVKINKLKLKSLVTASNNTRQYVLKREREEELELLQRCIDDVLSGMTTIMENTTEENFSQQYFALNTNYFANFTGYFRLLCRKNKNHGKITLGGCVDAVVHIPTFSDHQNQVKSIIVGFFLHLETLYINTTH